MDTFHEVALSSWDANLDRGARQDALNALERGQVLYFPSLRFDLSKAQQRLLNPAVLNGSSKNISFDPATGALAGTSSVGSERSDLQAMMAQYSRAADGLMRHLLGGYGSALALKRTSFRPAEIKGRQTSWRKDDSRLHVDSFPSMPTHGRRLLRIFCNVNADGRPRTWRLGEPFSDLAQRFWPKLRHPHWGERHLLYAFRVTRALRSEYDHYMLQLHDAMKADTAYQRHVTQLTYHFPTGVAWACFTDQVSHAAMAGQHQLEQTFSLPVEYMHQPSTSPLRVLEAMAGRALIPEGLRSAA
jgi:hypothetical protein